MGRKRPGDENDHGAKSENSPNPADRKSRRVISAPIFWSMEALPDGVGTGGWAGPLRSQEVATIPAGESRFKPLAALSYKKAHSRETAGKEGGERGSVGLRLSRRDRP